MMHQAIHLIELMRRGMDEREGLRVAMDKMGGGGGWLLGTWAIKIFQLWGIVVGGNKNRWPLLLLLTRWGIKKMQRRQHAFELRRKHSYGGTYINHIHQIIPTYIYKLWYIYMHAAHIYTHIAYIENCVFLWPTEVRTPKHMEHATRHRFQGFRKYIVHKFTNEAFFVWENKEKRNSFK